ncbi:hypothetical protein LR48_Vigan598s001300 [Vigna angularis]|uniref:HAT C-terminal dimerisation domain-containing protein n=1 Tax=Phaseolus angularis TaxID=3914 RepID=A0A0L9TE85_PHAAN|nr:hypothetical protein LR48_Vigan598s001300 [Vigna angularis]
MKCRNTTVSDVEKEYLEQKDKVKEMMSRIPNRICLTSDVWTAVTYEGYICKGGRVLSKYRSSILPGHVQMLICTQNWLYGFSENPSDKIVEDIFGHERSDESKLLEDVESLQH